MGDMRKVRSNKYLVDALVRLMKKKNIQLITINEIVNEAQLARSTFYHLYESKQQFIDQIIEDMFVRLREETKANIFLKTAGFDKSVWFEYYKKHFEFISQNSDFFFVMLSNNGVSSFSKKMEKSALITYNEILKDIDETKLSIPKYYLIQYIISAHIGLTFKWLQDNMIYSPSYMSELLNRLTFEGIFHSLNVESMVNIPK